MRTRLPAACAAILPLLAACASGGAGPRAELLGTPAAPAGAMHTVTITPATRWVDVDANDAVRFVANGQEFAWVFNGNQTFRVFDLKRVAPPGVLGRELPVYVKPDPGFHAGGR